MTQKVVKESNGNCLGADQLLGRFEQYIGCVRSQISHVLLTMSENVPWCL